MKALILALALAPSIASAAAPASDMIDCKASGMVLAYHKRFCIKAGVEAGAPGTFWGLDGRIHTLKACDTDSDCAAKNPQMPVY